MIEERTEGVLTPSLALHVRKRVTLPKTVESIFVMYVPSLDIQLLYTCRRVAASRGNRVGYRPGGGWPPRQKKTLLVETDETDRRTRTKIETDDNEEKRQVNISEGRKGSQIALKIKIIMVLCASNSTCRYRSCCKPHIPPFFFA